MRFKVDENLPDDIAQALNLMDQEPLVGRLWIVEEHQIRIRGEKAGT